MQTTETVYKDRSNPNKALFYEDNSALDFTAATRVVLKLWTIDGDLEQTVDSDSSPSLVTWTDTTVSPNILNVITFSLNSLTLSGSYYAEVVIYDSTHPAGQVIAHPDSPHDLLSFSFVDA